MKRVKQKDNAGRHTGGIVWHTQGSGKSITMVMLAWALALDPEMTNPRMILVPVRPRPQALLFGPSQPH